MSNKRRKRHNKSINTVSSDIKQFEKKEIENSKGSIVEVENNSLEKKEKDSETTNVELNENVNETKSTEVDNVEPTDISIEQKEINNIETEDSITEIPELVFKDKSPTELVIDKSKKQLDTDSVLDDKKQNTKSKSSFFSKKSQILILIAILIFLICSGLYAISAQKQMDANIETKSLIENSTVIKWVNLFMNESYVNADNYLANTKYRIYNYTFLDTVDEVEYYDTAISYLSKCIQSVKVDKIVEGQYNNQSVYTLKVTIVPYKQISSLENTLKDSEFSNKLTELRDECITNSISEYEYSSKLKELTLDIYKESCFQPETEAIELTLVLAQQQNEQGDMVVYGVEDFISAVIENSNVYTNTEIYQNEIAIYLQDNTIKSENIENTDNKENLENKDKQEN